MRTKPKLPLLQRGHPLARGLVGAWLFYEGGGITVHGSGPRRELGTFSGTLSWGQSRFGPVVNFGGGHITTNLLPASGSQHRTIVYRIYPTSASRHMSWGAKINGQKYTVRADDIGRLRIEVEGDGWTSTLSPTLNAWNFIALVLSGTTLAGHTFYLNGVSQNGTGTTTVNTSATNALQFSDQFDGNPAPAGLWDFAYFYNRALTPGEIRTLFVDPYQAFRPRSAHIGALTASEVETTTVRLTWQDNSGDEDGFIIERSTDGDSFDVVDTVAAGTTQYDDELPTGTTFYYRVRAYNDDGNSDYSNVAQITTAA